MKTEKFFRLAKRTAFAVTTLALLAGCASSRLYSWGGYDRALYQGYKDPEKVVELQTSLETHIAAMSAQGVKVAPGLHAELGSLYLQSGKNKEALVQYQKERDAWPESRTLMDSMIKTIESRDKANQEGKAV